MVVQSTTKIVTRRANILMSALNSLLCLTAARRCLIKGLLTILRLPGTFHLNRVVQQVIKFWNREKKFIRDYELTLMTSLALFHLLLLECH